MPLRNDGRWPKHKSSVRLLMQFSFFVQPRWN
jgi:hypothetical protein